MEFTLKTIICSVTSPTLDSSDLTYSAKLARTDINIVHVPTVNNITFNVKLFGFGE